jgi:hypothetical protein
VWIHVMLATLTWLTTLWAIAAEGSLAPRRAPVPAYDRQPEQAAGPSRRSVAAG